MSDERAPIRCPGCAATRAPRAVMPYREWTLYECPECGLQHFWPARNPGSEWYEANEMYAGRDLMVVDWLGWYHREGLEHVPPDARSLIDVGCGNGAFVAAARDRGIDAWGIDFSHKAIDAGKKRFGLENLHAMSIDDLVARFPDRKFDVVTAFEVLEHMDDAGAFIRELRRLLRPGGRLIVSVPNRDRRPWLLNEGDLPPHHFTRWSVPVIRGFLARHGLTPERVVVCPTRITLRAALLYAIRLDLVVRLMRRAERTSSADARDRVVGTARRLTLLKERAADVAALVLSPFAKPFVRGPMLVAVAREPAPASRG